MNPQYLRQKSLFLFDLKTMKFQTCGDMRIAKTFNQSVHFHEGFLYAFGGNEKDACEKYDTYLNKWEVIASYGELLNAKICNELNGWTQVYCPITP